MFSYWKWLLPLLVLNYHFIITLFQEKVPTLKIILNAEPQTLHYNIQKTFNLVTERPTLRVGRSYSQKEYFLEILLFFQKMNFQQKAPVIEHLQNCIFHLIHYIYSYKFWHEKIINVGLPDLLFSNIINFKVYYNTQ